MVLGKWTTVFLKSISRITYSKRYVDTPSNEFELKRDDNVNSDISSDKFKRTFVFLILQYYEEFTNN